MSRDKDLPSLSFAMALHYPSTYSTGTSGQPENWAGTRTLKTKKFLICCATWCCFQSPGICSTTRLQHPRAA